MKTEPQPGPSRHSGKPGANKRRVWIAPLLFFGACAASAQVTTLDLNPTADAFTRSAVPAGNFGGGGALSVSGAAAVNGSGQQNGLFDTFLRFAAGSAVSTFDAIYGVNGWVLTDATLKLTEVGAPGNATFNRGVGPFDVRWVGDDTWVEGTGTPNVPTADGITYQTQTGFLNAGADLSLGTFSNSGTNGLRSFTLSLASSFVADVKAGGDVSFQLTASGDSVGFNFNSRQFGTPSALPALELSAAAVPEPPAGVVSVLMLLVFAAGRSFKRIKS